jgi:LysM repeat protein
MTMNVSEPGPEEEYEPYQPYSPLGRQGWFNRPLLPYAIGGAVLLAVIGLWAVFRGSPTPSIDPARLTALEQRIGELDGRIMYLEQATARLPGLEAGAKDTAGLTKRLENLEASLEKNLNDLSQKLQKLEKAPAPKAAAAPAAPAPAKAARVQAKTHVVKAGETLYQISRLYNLKVDDLIRLNGWSGTPTIQPGQKIIVSKGGN